MPHNIGGLSQVELHMMEQLARSEAVHLSKLGILAEQCHDPQLRHMVEDHRRRSERALQTLVQLAQNPGWTGTAGAGVQAGYRPVAGPEQRGPGAFDRPNPPELGGPGYRT